MRTLLILLYCCLTASAQTWVSSPAFRGAAAIQGAPVSGGAAPAVIATNGVFGTNNVALTSAGTKTTNTLANVPANSLLVVMSGNGGGGDNPMTPTANRSLDWVQQAAAYAANKGPAYIWTAYDYEGGTIWVTNTCGNSAYISSSLSAVTNSGGMAWIGAKAQVLSSTAPSTNLTTLGTNSIVFCINSDWEEKTTAITYRTTPTAVIADNDISGQTRITHWYHVFGNPQTNTLGQSAPTAQGASMCALEIRVPLPVSGVATGQMLVDFNTAMGTVTAENMASSTYGTALGTWVTQDDPYANPATDTGSTPGLTITNKAYYALPSGTSFNVNGTTYPGGSTNGMRVDCSYVNAAKVTWTQANGYTNMSAGAFVRFGGTSPNNSGRVFWSWRDNGNYQIAGLSDAGGSGAPIAAFHYQPGGTGIGSPTITVRRNHWYWWTVNHVAAGVSGSVSIYDPHNNWALVGTSSGTPTAGSIQQNLFLQIGHTFDTTTAVEWFDICNILIDTNAVFPLKPF